MSQGQSWSRAKAWRALHAKWMRKQHWKRAKAAFALLAAARLASACTSETSLGDAGMASADGGARDAEITDASMACTVLAPTSCPEPALTYADVEPIFAKRCVICHVGQEDSPWPLTTYSHVADWNAEIRGAVVSCIMPPPDAGVAITDDERHDILTWIRCGFPK
jgi:uncharacterized membrane protein